MSPETILINVFLIVPNFMCLFIASKPVFLSHNHETKVCNCCLAGAWPNVLINSQNQIIKTNKENWCRVLTIKFAAKSLWFEPNRVWNFISMLPRRLRKYFINIEQSESHGKLFGSFITLIKEGWKIPKNLKPSKAARAEIWKTLISLKSFHLRGLARGF